MVKMSNQDDIDDDLQGNGELDWKIFDILCQEQFIEVKMGRL